MSHRAQHVVAQTSAPVVVCNRRCRRVRGGRPQRTEPFGGEPERAQQLGGRMQRCRARRTHVSGVLLHGIHRGDDVCAEGREE